MNIFYIDSDPIIAAQQLADKHVVKMCLESAQMLCTTHHTVNTPNIPYRCAHLNHPSTQWVRQSIQHYDWLLEHGKEICREYTRRYGKVHKTEAVLEWCTQNKPALRNFKFIEPPKCMDPKYKLKDTVESYRKFYNEEKVGEKKLTWDKAPHRKPDWIYL